MNDKFQFKYSVSYDRNRAGHILFDLEIPINDIDSFKLNLPVWRPGRYEIANYAQYLKDFRVTGKGKKALKYEKTESHVWQVDCKGETKLKISYSFYSKRIDAGFSYADESQIYLNPVNCFLFVPEHNCEYEISFKVPKSFKVHGPLQKLKWNSVKSHSYAELFDSPMIVSKNAKVQTFKVGKYTIHNIFQGVCDPDLKRIQSDYKKFIKLQIDSFGDLPVKEFSFLNQITSHRFYHGVEHKKNTVLAIGPGYRLNEDEGYQDLLGLACHEFYHIWNVKHLRPKSLLPYDFTKENFHHVGFVIEGITTYQGDVKLWQSGVIEDNAYLKLLEDQINKHVTNFGRTNQSVRESSMDLWLDGYVEGVPGKKVSIYTEGCLIALMTDIYLLEKTKGKKSLDDVMRKMYVDFGKKDKGYTEQEYIEAIVDQGGSFARKLHKAYINNAAGYEKELKKCLAKVGLDIVKKPISHSASYLGLRTSNKMKPEVLNVVPNSPAELAGFAEDMTIISVNGMEVNKDLDNWINFFKGKVLDITVSFKGEMRKLKCVASENLLVYKVEVKKMKKASTAQNKLFKQWRKH